MSTIFNIPVQLGSPQSFPITLSGVGYQLTFKYMDVDQGGWVIDIADQANNPIIRGIPMITGLNLLEPYPDLGFGGGLWVQTTDDPDAVPTFDNLGGDALLYWVTS